MWFFFQRNKLTANSGSGISLLCFLFLHLVLSSEGCLGCSAPWSPLPRVWHRSLPPTASFCEDFFLFDIFLPFEFTCITYLLCKFLSYLCFYSHWTSVFPRGNKLLSLSKCWGPRASQGKASTKPHPWPSFQFYFIVFSLLFPPLIYLLSKVANDFFPW